MMQAMLSSRPFLQGPLPIAFAHRGGSLLWPENTMLSFEGAVALAAATWRRMSTSPKTACW
jgi:glycerophosphoryl diester phosphodiesterase